jgi:hypothetical protein
MCPEGAPLEQLAIKNKDKLAGEEDFVFAELLEEAKKEFALGHDDMYISNQFAEQGVDDETIDKVLLEVKGLRNRINKQEGKRTVVYGLSFILVGLGATYFSTRWSSPVGYILWALPVFGVVATVKGISKIVG